MTETKDATAEHVTRFCANASQLSFLVADAMVIRSWKGSQLDDNYEELPGSDFSRAMEIEVGSIEVGGGLGVLAEVGDCGCTEVFRRGNSWIFPFGIFNQGVAVRDVLQTLVTQLKPTDVLDWGEFEVKCGCFGVCLPEENAAESSADAIEESKRTGKSVSSEPVEFIPGPDGTYRVFWDIIDHQDDQGRVAGWVRIEAPST